MQSFETIIETKQLLSFLRSCDTMEQEGICRFLIFYKKKKDIKETLNEQEEWFYR